ncbi:MAG TPA: FAD-dependent oxidoreductase [Actinomycetota bacterium]|nr:FAD-dependent oxidoreductase [Actinomycetota bacterium]
MTADLLVLGGGPAGVGAAWRAARAGHSVVLLERAATPGGSAASVEVGGMRVDLGSHRLHRSIAPEILAELRALLGDDLQVRPRNGRIRLAGRWLAFPLRPADVVCRLPPSFALGAARDAATAWTRRPRADTFADVLRARLGPTMCERFYFPYARKLWGLEPHEISGEQARRRVSADSAAKIARRVVRGVRPEARTFLYPRRGYGQICEALADGAARAGADVRFGVAATRVRTSSRGVEVETSEGERLEARRAWSTLPLTALVRMMEPPPPDAVLDAVAALEFRAMALVYLVCSTDRYTPFDAHYLPEEWTPVTRVSEPKNYRDGDDPGGVTVLCAEVPCRRGDATWTAPDDELGAVAARALTRAGLPPPPVDDVVVRRIPFVYPVYRVGFEHALDAVDDWLAGVPNVLTFGRGGSFVHDNAHHALAMAWAAADALEPGGGFDHASWAAARARFAGHVVED